MEVRLETSPRRLTEDFRMGTWTGESLDFSDSLGDSDVTGAHR